MTSITNDRSRQQVSALPHHQPVAVGGAAAFGYLGMMAGFGGLGATGTVKAGAALGAAGAGLGYAAFLSARDDDGTRSDLLGGIRGAAWGGIGGATLGTALSLMDGVSPRAAPWIIGANAVLFGGLGALTGSDTV